MIELMTMAPALRTLFKDRTTLVWAGLALATIVSWQIGTDGAFGAKATTTVVLVVAFGKVRFVGAYFMELRRAPWALRAVFDGWCVVVCAVLLIGYLTGSL